MTMCKYKLYIYCFISVLILTTGCFKKSHNDDFVDYGNVMTLDVKITDNIIDISELIQDVEFVRLETSDDCIIGQIDKLIQHKGDYYVLDRRMKKVLLRFDKNGRFMNTIGRQGRGPGEYNEPTDFIIVDTTVVILDQYSRSLSFFDCSGKFIETKKNDQVIYEITYLGGDLILAVTGENRKDVKNYELLVMDMNGNIHAKSIYNSNTINYSSGYSSVHNETGATYFKSLRSDVFEVKILPDIQCYHKYHMNISPLPLPADFEKECKGDYENFITKYKNTNNYFSGNFAETDSHIIFYVRTIKNYSVVALTDKSDFTTKTGILTSQRSLNFDEYKIISSFLPRYITTSGNKIISYADPGMFLIDKDIENRFPHLSGIKESDNPIVFSFLFKGDLP